jgi:hypothetical protein
MRFPITLACLGLMLSAALGAASLSSTSANQAQNGKSDATVVAYRGSGRISNQW